jgi:hypothetical protein
MTRTVLVGVVRHGTFLLHTEITLGLTVYCVFKFQGITLLRARQAFVSSFDVEHMIPT